MEEGQECRKAQRTVSTDMRIMIQQGLDIIPELFPCRPPLSQQRRTVRKMEWFNVLFRVRYERSYTPRLLSLRLLGNWAAGDQPSTGDVPYLKICFATVNGAAFCVAPCLTELCHLPGAEDITMAKETTHRKHNHRKRAVCIYLYR